MARPNFGHIQRLGHNHYRLFWGKGYRPDGKRDRHTLTFRGTRQEAELLLAQKLGTWRKSREVTWGQFWVASVEPTYEGLAQRTVDDYRELYEKHLKPHIQDYQVSDTDEIFIDDILARVKAPSTQRHVKDLWRKACRIAVRRKLLPYCPIDASTPLKPLRHRPKRLLDVSEIHTYISNIEGFRGELCVLAMLGGGLRPEEAYALHYEDIQDYQGYALITVSKALTDSHGKVLKDTKNGYSEREVVIGEPFSSRILQIEGVGIILNTGKPGIEAYMAQSTFSHSLKAYCENKGIPYIEPKNLRSSFATLHGEAGSPDSLVEGAMGHSGTTTKTRHYQRVTRRGLVLIADILAEYLCQTVPNQ